MGVQQSYPQPTKLNTKRQGQIKYLEVKNQNSNPNENIFSSLGSSNDQSSNKRSSKIYSDTHPTTVQQSLRGSYDKQLHQNHIQFDPIISDSFSQIEEVSQNQESVGHLLNMKKDSVYLSHSYLGGIQQKNGNKRMISNGFLISNKLLLTSSKSIMKYRLNQIIFYAYSTKFLYQIEIIYHPEEFLKNEHELELNYCLIRLKRPVQLPKYMILGVNMQIEHLDIYLHTLEIMEEQQYQLNKYNIEKIEINNKRKLCYYTLECKKEQNGAVILWKSKIGNLAIAIHSQNQNGRRNTCTARLIEEDLIQNLYNWTTRFERESIQVYQPNEKRQKTLKKYAQKLNLQYKIMSSRLKFDKSNLIQKSQQALHERMGGYLDFQISDKFIEYITVKNIRLYYELYAKEKIETIQDLNRQYLQMTKSNLILSNRDIKMSVKIPVKELIFDSKSKDMFEKLLDDLQENKFSINQFPTWFLQNLQKLESTQIYIKMLKRQQKIWVIVKKKEMLIQKFDLPIKQTTTVLDIIKIISDKEYDVKNMDIYGNYGIINGKNFNQRINYLKITELKFCLFDNQSFISIHSKLWVKEQEIKQVWLKDIQMERKQFQILSFSQQNNVLKYQLINKIHKNKQVKTCYSISYRHESTVCELQCTGDTLIKVSHEKWMKVKEMELGQKILGVKGDKNIEVVEYTLIERTITYENVSRKFYGFQIANTHNFIANNLIIHNSDLIQLKVVKIKDSKIIQYLKYVYRSDLISKAFERQDVFISGTMLNKQLTFGDYQIDSCKFIFARSASSIMNEADIMKDNRLVVSQWRENCKTYHSYTEDQKSKWKKHYIGLYQNNLLELDSQVFADLQSNHIPHFIIQQKKIIRRIYYYENKELYKGFERKIIFKEYQDLKESLFFKQIVKNNPLIKEDIIFTIFLYTTSVSKQINKNMRESDNKIKKGQNFEHYQCLSYYLCESLDALPSLESETLVYRGIPNIPLNFGEEPYKFILFKQFVSTSYDKETALSFAGKKGILLEILTVTGKWIQRYSIIPKENQVLILPFTYFLYQGQRNQGSRRVIRLRQIALPLTKVDNLVFWIDDKHENNTKIIKRMHEEIEEKIQVVRISSTQIMKVVLRYFFWLYTLFGKRFTIVSDMVRNQGNAINYTAGADMLKLIYNQLGLSNELVIFTSNGCMARRALQAIQIKETLNKKWKITTIASQIIKSIREESKTQFNQTLQIEDKM